MTYLVKTRNWNCRRWVHRLLAATPTVQRGDNYKDGDGKFVVETPSSVRAWLTWAYWMLLRRWSGGWTYIIRDREGFVSYNGTYKSTYKSIY